jgi:hypothetical protein
MSIQRKLSLTAIVMVLVTVSDVIDSTEPKHVGSRAQLELSSLTPSAESPGGGVLQATS